jgi:hypothetical protein
VVPEVKTISAGSSAPIDSIAAGASCGRSSSSTAATSAIVIAGTPGGSSPSRASSPTQSLGLAAATRSPRSARRSCVLQGSATAPIRQQASRLSTHSIRFPTSVITTSPRLTPRAANAPDSPAEQAINSPKYQSRRFASASTVTIPSRDAGERSIKSSIKFTAGSLP